MSSQIELINHALTKLGAARIISMDDDNLGARSMSSAWNIVRDTLLRGYSWRFAITRTRLAELIDAVVWGYEHQYELPSDCIRLVQIGENMIDINSPYYLSSDNSAYQLEGRKILTDITAPLKIRYIRRVEDTTEYDACFSEMLAQRLAIQCCEDITNSGTTKDSLRQEYQKLERDALRANAFEIASQGMPDTIWITSRL